MRAKRSLGHTHKLCYFRQGIKSVENFSAPAGFQNTRKCKIWSPNRYWISRSNTCPFTHAVWAEQISDQGACLDAFKTKIIACLNSSPEGQNMLWPTLLCAHHILEALLLPAWIGSRDLSHTQRQNPRPQFSSKDKSVSATWCSLTDTGLGLGPFCWKFFLTFFRDSHWSHNNQVHLCFPIQPHRHAVFLYTLQEKTALEVCRVHSLPSTEAQIQDILINPSNSPRFQVSLFHV